MRSQLCFEIKKIMYRLYFHIFRCNCPVQKKKQNAAIYNHEPNNDMEKRLAKSGLNEVI